MFNGSVNKGNLKDVYQFLLKVTSSNNFLMNMGLNKEVPFHICPYSPTIQSEINSVVKQLINELEEKAVKAFEVNIYDLVIDILKQEGDWEWILENESGMSREVLKEELQGILDIEAVVAPAIAEKMNSDKFDLLIITGIGEVFPYIRSHNILNNLQKRAKEKPTLLFFPGKYKHSLESGASLVLFGSLQDDRYYRAFNILDRAI